jgi:hypothetical protein
VEQAHEDEHFIRSKFTEKIFGDQKKQFTPNIKL